MDTIIEETSENESESIASSPEVTPSNMDTLSMESPSYFSSTKRTPLQYLSEIYTGFLVETHFFIASTTRTSICDVFRLLAAEKGRAFALAHVLDDIVLALPGLVSSEKALKLTDNAGRSAGTDDRPGDDFTRYKYKTFDLSVDANYSPSLSTDESMIESDATQAKIGFVACIATICGTIGFDEELHDALVTRFLPHIEKYATDRNYTVRRETVNGICALASICRDASLLRIIVQLYKVACDDEVWQVRDSACLALPKMIKYASQQPLDVVKADFDTPDTVPVFFDDVNRPTMCVYDPSAGLMGRKDHNGNFEYFQSADKRVAIQSDASALGPTWLPDEIVWKRALLTTVLFNKFSHDISKWVSSAADKIIGELFAVFPPENAYGVPMQIFRHYEEMMASVMQSVLYTTDIDEWSAYEADQLSAGRSCLEFLRVSNDTVDCDRVSCASFMFPAVLYTLGKRHWPDLRPYFRALKLQRLVSYWKQIV